MIYKMNIIYEEKSRIWNEPDWDTRDISLAIYDASIRHPSIDINLWASRDNSLDTNM